MGAPIAFPQSELDKLRDLPVWKTLSGKRVAVERNQHFSLDEGADVGNLPLPTGAAKRCVLPPEPNQSHTLEYMLRARGPFMAYDCLR